MLLLTLLEAGGAVAEAAAQPPDAYGALIAIAGAVGALALALGRPLKVLAVAKAEERKAEAAERKSLAEAQRVAGAVDEKKLAEHVLAVFRAYYGDRVVQLLKHHLEIHDATFGNKVTGTDGIKQHVERLEELSQSIAAEVSEMYRHQAEARHQQELVAAAERALTGGGTNPGTGRR